MQRACIVGWAHTPFGKLDDPDVESLMGRVSGQALEHAGIGPEAVDGISVGVMNNGFSKQGFEAALVALGQPALGLRAGDAGRECLRHRLGCPLHAPWTSSRAAAAASRSSSAPRR